MSATFIQAKEKEVAYATLLRMLLLANNNAVGKCHIIARTTRQQGWI